MPILTKEDNLVRLLYDYIRKNTIFEDKVYNVIDKSDIGSDYWCDVYDLHFIHGFIYLLQLLHKDLTKDGNCPDEDKLKEEWGNYKMNCIRNTFLCDQGSPKIFDDLSTITIKCCGLKEFDCQEFIETEFY